MEKRKKRTLEEKLQIVARAKVIGAAAASKEFNAHPTQIREWARGRGLNPSGGSRPGRIIRSNKNGGTHARSSKGASTNGTPNLEVEAFVAYTWGGLERDIKTFARSQHVPEEVVAGRLGEILRGKARGHVLRA